MDLQLLQQSSTELARFCQLCDFEGAKCTSLVITKDSVDLHSNFPGSRTLACQQELLQIISASEVQEKDALLLKGLCKRYIRDSIRVAPADAIVEEKWKTLWGDLLRNLLSKNDHTANFVSCTGEEVKNWYKGELLEEFGKEMLKPFPSFNTLKLLQMLANWAVNILTVRHAVHITKKLRPVIENLEINSEIFDLSTMDKKFVDQRVVQENKQSQNKASKSRKNSRASSPKQKDRARDSGQKKVSKIKEEEINMEINDKESFGDKKFHEMSEDKKTKKEPEKNLSFHCEIKGILKVFGITQVNINDENIHENIEKFCTEHKETDSPLCLIVTSKKFCFHCYGNLKFFNHIFGQNNKLLFGEPHLVKFSNYVLPVAITKLPGYDEFIGKYIRETLTGKDVLMFDLEWHKNILTETNVKNNQQDFNSSSLKDDIENLKPPELKMLFRSIKPQTRISIEKIIKPDKQPDLLGIRKNDGYLYGTLPDGTELAFKLVQSKEDGSCGFQSLNVKRQTVANSLLSLKNDEATRKRLGPEIADALISYCINAKEMGIVLTNANRQILKTEYKNAFIDRTQGGVEKFNEFCCQEAIFEAYVRSFESIGWMGIESALVYAERSRLLLYFWYKPPDGNDVLLSKWSEPQDANQLEIIHILFNFSHFDVLKIDEIETAELKLQKKSKVVVTEEKKLGEGN